MPRKSFQIAALMLLFTNVYMAAPAEELVWTTGKVLAGGRVVRDAMVAAFDQKGHVIDYAKTDSEGYYALAVPRSAMGLGKKEGGFFHEVSSGVNRLIGGTAGTLKMGIRAAAGAANVTSPVTRVGVGTASGVAQGLITPPKGKRPDPLPGALLLKVVYPGHNDAVALGKAYWIQEEIYRAGGKEQRSLAAWIDPVDLTVADSEKPSTITSKYLLFTRARMEPSITEVGQRVSISVSLPTPPEPRTPLVVVARNSKTGHSIELHEEGNGLYRGEFIVEKSFPKNDQVYCILAYAEQSDKPGRNKSVEDAINGAGMWNSHKPFVYNPLIVVSRNRAEVTLTVVESSRRR